VGPKQDGKDRGAEVELEAESFVKFERELEFAHDTCKRGWDLAKLV
jgi:hypothetical protein